MSIQLGFNVASLGFHLIIVVFTTLVSRSGFRSSSGTSMLHIWEPLLSTLKNGDSYLFTNLTVRNFQGSTFLSTSPLTTTSPSTTTLKTLSGPEMLKSPEKEVTAKCIDLVAKLNIFCSCTVCKKKLNDAESFSCATLKCENCGTRQRAKSVKRQATVRLCITDSATKEEIWIQAFSRVGLKPAFKNWWHRSVPYVNWRFTVHVHSANQSYHQSGVF